MRPAECRMADVRDTQRGAARSAGDAPTCAPANASLSRPSGLTRRTGCAGEAARGSFGGGALVPSSGGTRTQARPGVQGGAHRSPQVSENSAEKERAPLGRAARTPLLSMKPIPRSAPGSTADARTSRPGRVSSHPPDEARNGAVTTTARGKVVAADLTAWSGLVRAEGSEP